MSRPDRQGHDDVFRGEYYGSSHRHGSGADIGGNLQPPQTLQRPRSVPPPSRMVVESGPLMTPALRTQSRSPSRGREPGRRRRSRSRSAASSRGRHRHHGPVEHAQSALKNTFTSSNSGLGIGILGAIVGGLAARHVSDSTGKLADRRHSNDGHGHHQHHREHDRERESRLFVSTIVGAAVGGLGANALERRLEISRDKRAERGGEVHSDRRRRGRSAQRRGLNADYYHPEDSRDVDDHVYEARLARRRRSQDADYRYRPPKNRPLEYR